MKKKPNETLLNSVEESRRDFVRKLVAGTAFAVPLLASFSTDGAALIGEAQGVTAGYFCGDGSGITDIVFRAAAKTPDNAVRFSAVVRGDALDCSSITVNLQFVSKNYEFFEAALFPGPSSPPISISVGLTQIRDNAPDILIDLCRGEGRIVVQTTPFEQLSGELVGTGAV